MGRAAPDIPDGMRGIHGRFVRWRKSHTGRLPIPESLWSAAAEVATAAASSSDLLFPSETGTPFRLGNYLKRCLKPLAKKADIPDLTYQALRRTCATHFQKHGKPRDIQAQLRHSRLEMTGRYVKEIPDQVRVAVDSMDRELCPETGQKRTVQ
jgi:integrase